MKKFFLLTFVIFTIFVTKPRNLDAFFVDKIGNSILGIDLSVGTPMFYNDLSKVYSTNIYPGGLGALNYQYYILDDLSIGFELRYMFNFDINFSLNLLNPDSSTGKTFFSVPLTFLTTYVIEINEMFQIPIFSNIGISLNSYGTSSDNIANLRTFDVLPVISLGSGFLWNINYKWSIGATAAWWMMFEFGDSGKTGHFLMTSLSVKVNLSK